MSAQVAIDCHRKNCTSFASESRVQHPLVVAIAGPFSN